MKLALAGDICLQGIPADRFAIDPRLRDLLTTCDLRIANLESPLTERVDQMPFQPVHLKGLPEPHPLLDVFDCFSLANNHILDYHAAGLEDTRMFLRSYGKTFFGAGSNRTEAARPLIVEQGPHRLALVGVTPWYNATQSRSGTQSDRRRGLPSQIRGLRGDGCFVIVYSHWNYEYVDYPAPANRRFAQRLIDAGAHLVVGAHPHVLQGRETYKNRSVYHSLGNFVFHDAGRSATRERDDRWYEGLLLIVDVDEEKGYQCRHVPTRFVDNSNLIMDDEPARLERLETLSSVFERPKAYRDAFYSHAAAVLSQTSAVLTSMSRKQGVLSILKRLHRIRLQDVLVAINGAFRQRQQCR
jgi:hypothetical protein